MGFSRKKERVGSRFASASLWAVSDEGGRRLSFVLFIAVLCAPAAVWDTGIGNHELAGGKRLEFGFVGVSAGVARVRCALCVRPKVGLYVRPAFS